MASVRQLSDEYQSALTLVPPAELGICDICHKFAGSGWRRCWSCKQTVGPVSHPLTTVMPLSLYVLGGQLHHLLSGYKNSYSEAVRARLRPYVAALASRFLSVHHDCLVHQVGSDWDYLTTIPSTSGRVGPHPLERALGMVQHLKESHRRVLAAGASPVQRLKPRDDAFTVPEDVRGDTILLLDDTFTSGTRVQSAASALTLAGATVLGAVVLGRVFDPHYSDETRDFWRDQERRPFSFDWCCFH